MDSTDLARAEHSARLRYEWEEFDARSSALRRSNVVGVAVAIAVIERRPCASVLRPSFAGVAMLWYGRESSARCFPESRPESCPGDGACASHVETRMHRRWVHDALRTCVHTWVASSRPRRCEHSTSVAGSVWFWVSASSIALLTGAMGCTCPAIRACRVVLDTAPASFHTASEGALRAPPGL